MDSSKSDIGCYVSGLFLQGAKWDTERNGLTELPLSMTGQLASLTRSLTASRSTQLQQVATPLVWSELPVVWLKPCLVPKNTSSRPYKCPIYRLPRRNFHSSYSSLDSSKNFVMSINIPSSYLESHWVKRGVSIVTQTPY
jgi:dynein heavy chain